MIQNLKSKIPLVAVGAIMLAALTSWPGISNSVYSVALQRHFEIDLKDLGLLYSLALLPGMITVLVMGWAIARWGPVRPLFYVLLGCSAGVLLAAAKGGWPLFLGAMAFVGAFSGPLHVGVQAWLARTFRNHSRRIMSLQLAVVSLAAVIFPIQAEYLLELTNRAVLDFDMVLHLPYVYLAAVFFIALLGVSWGTFFAKRDKPVATEKHGLETSWRFDAGSLGLMLLCIMHGAADAAGYLWLPRVLRSELAFAELVCKPGYVLAAAAMAYAVSRLILSLLPENFGKKIFMVAPGLVGGGLFLLGVLSHSQFWTGTCYVAGAFCWSLEYPVFIGAMARRAGRRFGLLNSLAMAGSCLVCAAVTYSMGWAAELLDEKDLWLILLVPAAGFICVGLGGALWVYLYGREPAAAEVGAEG